MFSIIKPRGDIKANWESVNPVLRLREWGVEWEEFVGTGDVKVKIGDGVKHWNELDYAIINDVTKKIVKTFAEVNSDDNPNPILNPGESIDALFGKIKQKFEYSTNFMTSLKNMVGDYQARSFNTGSGTVTADDLKSAIDILEQYKLTTANILDVNDSTNTFAALSANQGRLINEKAVANANAISTLNSNLTIKYSAFIPSAGIDVFYNNNINKFGRIACYNFQTSAVSLKSGQIIANIPIGFRPIVTSIGIATQENGEPIAYNISTDGNVIIYGNIDSKLIIISGAYIVAE